MDTAIVVFTRDLRLHDNPALHQAYVRARQVVPLFVMDPAIAAPTNRARFLAESLDDLRASLRERGADLILRRGDPAGDATSRLSAYLRFGCVSPLEVAIGALDRPGGEEYCRQIAWRDFFYQVTAAFPDIARKSYRPGAAWHEDRRALDAWREGQTGIPIVDAGLRQLAGEGSYPQVAQLLGVALGTVKTRIRDGLIRMRDCMEVTW